MLYINVRILWCFSWKPNYGLEKAKISNVVLLLLGKTRQKYVWTKRERNTAHRVPFLTPLPPMQYRALATISSNIPINKNI